jgi:hypothetical protein
MTPRSRQPAAGPGLRSFGWVVGAGLAVGALVAAALMWYIAVILPRGHQVERSADERARAVAQTIVDQLETRVVDGQLTTTDVAEAVRQQPARVLATRLDTDPLTVVAELHGATRGPFGSTRCYRFTVSRPLGSASRVNATELAGCPEETRRPGPSR